MKKIEGICSEPDCDLPIDSKGLCRKHYHRQYYYGRSYKVRNTGKRNHPLYTVWFENKQKNNLCEEWLYFWKFVEAVGERPSKGDRLLKIDESKPLSIDNFQWLKCIKRNPEETDKEWNALRWTARMERFPELSRSANTYKAVGLGIKEFNEIVSKKVKEQGHLCEICGKEETQLSKKNGTHYRLALDHCHKTGKLRGMLCWRCNTTLGKVEDSISLLKEMILYLEKHS